MLFYGHRACFWKFQRTPNCKFAIEETEAFTASTSTKRSIRFRILIVRNLRLFLAS